MGCSVASLSACAPESPRSAEPEREVVRPADDRADDGEAGIATYSGTHAMGRSSQAGSLASIVVTKPDWAAVEPKAVAGGMGGRGLVDALHRRRVCPVVGREFIQTGSVSSCTKQAVSNVVKGSNGVVRKKSGHEPETKSSKKYC